MNKQKKTETLIKIHQKYIKNTQKNTLIHAKKTPKDTIETQQQINTNKTLKKHFKSTLKNAINAHLKAH